MRSVLLFLLMVAACLCLRAALVRGQPGEPVQNDMLVPAAPAPLTPPLLGSSVAGTTPAAGNDMGTPELVALALMVAAYAFRRYARQGHWAHTASAQWILPIVPGAAEAVAKLIQAGAWTWRALAFGALSYVLSWLIQDNTSRGKDQPDPAKIQPPDPPAGAA